MFYISIIGFIVCLLIFLLLLIVHLGFRAPRNREKGCPADYGMNFVEVFIPTENNKQLFAWLLNVDDSSETIILLHGWGGNAELMLPIATPFYKAGINVLLIDSRNHGNSDSGSFSSMPRFAEDIAQAINWLKQHHPERVSNIALLGHSVGAGAVLLEASKRKDIQAVISVSAFAHPAWMMQRYLKRLHLPKLFIHLMFNYIEWIIGQKFSNIAPLYTTCCIDCPVLLIHGEDDKTVPLEDARAILSYCNKSSVSLLEVKNAGHNSIDQIEHHSAKLIDFLSDAGFSIVFNEQVIHKKILFT